MLKPSMRGFDPNALVPDARARAASSIAGWTLVALGATGVLGLLPQLSFLCQPFSGFYPLSLLAGLTLATLGAGLAGLAGGRRTAGVLGGAGALLVGSLTVIQYATGVDLGINPISSSPPAVLSLVRMPIASALLFSFGGAALLALALLEHRHRARLLAGGLGCVVVAFALGILSTTGAWDLDVQSGLLAGSSIQTLVGSLLGGASLVFIAWSADPGAATSAYWVPVSVGAGCLVTVIFLWRALIAFQEEQVREQASIAARTARREIYGQLETATRTLSRIARFSPVPKPGTQSWSNSMVALTRDIDGLLAIGWTDQGGTVRYIAPPSSDADTLRRNLEHGLVAALASSPTLSWHSPLYFPLDKAGRWFATAIPICGADGCTGQVIGVFDAERLLEPVLDNPGEGYAYTVGPVDGTEFLVSRQRPAGTLEMADESSFAVGDLNWSIRVRPTEDTLKRLHSRVPDLLLFTGLLVTALLPLTVRLAQMTWSRARLAERVRLNLALETATDGIWEWDVPTGAVLRSPALWRHLEYDPPSAPADLDTWSRLIHPDDQAKVNGAIEDHLAGKASSIESEYRIRDGGGGWHWVIDRGRVVERTASGAPLRVLGISADITERKRADEALEASERRFRACFDSAYQLQSLLDLDGRVLEANRTALDFAGISLDEVRGSTLWQTPMWRNTPSTRETLRAAFAESLEGSTVAREMELEGRNGRKAIIDLSMTPILGPGGKVIQVLAEGRDITARRQAEDQLREVESLSTMGRLAARVAHEINNPLAGIQNSFLLIKDAIPTDHPHYSYVGAIEREIGRIGRVTRQLYETYRPETDSSGETSIASVVGDAVALLEQINRDARVQIKVDLQRAPPVVRLPDALIRQALYNLVQNAVEASPPGGTVFVSAVAEDGMFALKVKDGGPGIPQEIRERVFEPFFTTKSSSVKTSGMGLGLSLVRRSVHALGGRVEILDVAGGGTEFVVRLPLRPKAAGEPS